MRLGIVQKQEQIFDVTTCSSIGLEFLKLGAPIPNIAGDQGSTIFDPGGGARQRVLKSAYVGFPGAKMEVEIVLSIAQGR